MALSIGDAHVKNFVALALGFSGLDGFFGADEDVSEVVLPFWSLFQEALTASPCVLSPRRLCDPFLATSALTFAPSRVRPSRHIETADAKAPAPEWLVAQEVFFELVRLMRRKVTLPADEGASWMQDQRDKFKAYRFEVGDCLVTACVDLSSLV